MVFGRECRRCRAHGLDIIDGVHLDIKDEASFRQACQRARAYGFDGKSLIHPSQIEPANVAFAPDTSALEHAERTIAAYEEAEASGLELPSWTENLLSICIKPRSERSR